MEQSVRGIVWFVGIITFYSVMPGANVRKRVDREEANLYNEE